MAFKSVSDHLTLVRCPRCTEIATKLCSGCQNIRYCSPECQQADWSTHKVLCRDFRNHLQSPSTDDDDDEKCRVVAFFPDEDKPRFMWAPVNHGFGYATIDPTDLFNVKHEYDPKLQIFYNSWTKKYMGYGIQVMFTKRARDNYHQSNKAIVTATTNLNFFDFRGPIFAFCGRLAGDGEMHEMLDMDMLSYAHLVAYLTHYYHEDSRYDGMIGDKVACVTMACSGDHANSPPTLQVVDVPRSHPIFRRRVPIRISDRLQMPLLTWKYPSTKVKNPLSSLMHVSCDPADTAFGRRPGREELNVGTQLIAFANQEDLTVETVEAFGDFCQFHLQPYFNWYFEEKGEGAATDAERRKEVADEITNEKWEAYLEQWQTEKKNAAAAKARGDESYTLKKASSGLERMGLTNNDADRITSILCTSHEAHIKLFKLG